MAGAVVLTTCVIISSSAWAEIFGKPESVKLPSEWWMGFGLVIGFYFGRTNHTRTGGVGIPSGDR